MLKLVLADYLAGSVHLTTHRLRAVAVVVSLLKKLSILDWMLAIDFDNPQLLRLAKKLDNSRESYLDIFLGATAEYESKPKKALSYFSD